MISSPDMSFTSWRLSGRLGGIRGLMGLPAFSGISLSTGAHVKQYQYRSVPTTYLAIISRYRISCCLGTCTYLLGNAGNPVKLSTLLFVPLEPPGSWYCMYVYCIVPFHGTRLYKVQAIASDFAWTLPHHIISVGCLR